MRSCKWLFLSLFRHIIFILYASAIYDNKSFFFLFLTYISLILYRSLNGIFVIDNLGSLTNGALEYGFDKETWKEMVDECDRRYPLQELSTELGASIEKFAKVKDTLNIVISL